MTLIWKNVKSSTAPYFFGTLWPRSTRLLNFAVSSNTETEILQQELEAGQILDLYGNSLLRFAYSYVRNMADAQEVVQDTLIRYFSRKPDCPNERARKAWLMQVCANLSKNRLRFNRLRAHTNLDTLAEPGVLEEDLSYVWQAVSQLPPKYREVIHLYYEEGYRTPEIAQILVQKESTVRSWLTRGRKKLKEILLEAYDFD